MCVCVSAHVCVSSKKTTQYFLSHYSFSHKYHCPPSFSLLPTLGNVLSHGINILKSIFPFSLLGCQLSLKIAQNCKQDGKLRSFSRRAGIWLDRTSPSQHRALHTSPHSFQLVVLAEKPFVPLIQYKNHILQVRRLSSKSKVIPQVKQLRGAEIRPVFRSSDSQPRARGSY